MQRLSVDSSASKLYSYGGRKDENYEVDDLKRRESVSFSSSPHPPSSSSSSAPDYDDHELKDYKPRRFSLQSPFATTTTTRHGQEKLVHFIPVLTLICFVILYLSSHDPSQSDLAQFNGFMRPSKHLDSDENSDISGFINADALAIRTSIRNLQEETESYTTKSLPRRRTSHRKTADF